MATAASKRAFVRIALTAAAYFLSAGLGAGLSVSTSHGPITPFSPTIGISLALAILFGWRTIWPGIFLGGIAFELTQREALDLVLQLAAFKTLEAIIPAMILARFDFQPALNRLRDSLAVWVAINLCAAISATLSTLAVTNYTIISWPVFWDRWFDLFMADLIGGMVLGCLLLAWHELRPKTWTFWRAVEALSLLAWAVAVSYLVFFRLKNSEVWMPYWFFPVMVWAAVRFGPQGSTAGAALVCFLATWVTLGGSGPFHKGSQGENMLALQSFLGITCATSLILASTAQGRRRAEESLRESEANMAAAQRIARFGSWELDFTRTDETGDNPLLWSDECYRIFGFEPRSILVSNDLFFSRVHPNDREAVARAVARAVNQHAEYSITHRIILPNGEIRYVHERAKVFVDAQSGRTLKIVGTVHDITESQRAESQLRESEERYRLLADNATDMISRQNTLGAFLYVSPACRHLLGYEPEDLIGRDIYSFQHPDDIVTTRQANQALIEKEDIRSTTYRLRRRDGTYIWVETTARGLHDSNDGEVNELICITRDITERRSLESQLQQVQKMDAIGQLAGGVAHDFNNLLTVISGYVGVILAKLPAGDPLRDFVGEINKAAERAAALTRQLLAFSRRALLEPKILDLNSLITDSEKMIRRLVGEDIELTTLFASNLWPVKVDRAQMDQVILNLIVNARDAMPQGGKLTIETSNVMLDDNYARTRADAKPGPFVMLTATDTGCGMSRDVQDHIFEPFFTTKGMGKGTGLGLATVYGIIKQSGGHIGVYSEVGLGTTFKIYLPSAGEKAALPKASNPGPKSLIHGRGTILLVEDEEAVRMFAEHVLTEAGYRVVTAADGEEALHLAEKLLDQINLVLTDVVMPRMSGRQLVEAVHKLRPNLKVLYMSGYTDDAVLRHGVLTAEAAFLQKPFSGGVLSQKVNEVMNGK
jgi:PAS domain S-box-containing protein